MPQQASSLSESWVLAQAQNWLATIHYGSCGKGAVERVIVPARPDRRSFGLVAFFLQNKQPYLALLTAQTSATADELTWQNDQERAIRLGFTMLIWLAFTYILYFPGREFGWPLTYVLLALVLSGLFLLVSFYWFHRFLPNWEQLDRRTFQSVAYINQLGKMAANEKWLALAVDALPAEQIRQLEFQCRREGVGLLLVPRLGQPRLRCLPRADDFHFNYLEQYTEGATLHQKLKANILQATGRFSLTKALRQRQLYRTGTGLASAMLVIACLSLFATPLGLNRSGTGLRLSAFADSESRQETNQRYSAEIRRLEVEGYDIRYFVADSFWDQPGDAAQRIDRLKMAGIYSSYSVWMPDYLNTYIRRGTYCVLYGPPVADERLAHQMLEQNYYRLSDRNIETYFPRMFKVYLEKGQSNGAPQMLD